MEYPNTRQTHYGAERGLRGVVQYRLVAYLTVDLKHHVSKPASKASISAETSNQTLCSSLLSSYSATAMELSATAMVNVEDAYGKSHSLRALIDNGHLYKNEMLFSDHLGLQPPYKLL
ncbi:hypothetical protein J6590_038931 [Homalodisca vitripennis]|nr:hypothetical protein J6590_038931 [Homalodisca vitripennis]